MMIHFEKMTESSFEQFQSMAIPLFAANKVKNGDWKEVESLRLAKQAFEVILSNGYHTPGHFFQEILAGKDKVGYCWYCLQKEESSTVLYLYEIMIFPESRNKGYGTDAIELIRNAAHESGALSIRFHVFGFNKDAVRFYERAGFRIADYTMVQDLSIVPGENINIRPIAKEDNSAIATIIRNALAEFGANHPGTVYYDASTDHLYELFREKRSAYYIATKNGEVVGGAGIFPTEGLPEGTCELVKMYLSPAARGKGLGRLLIEKSLQRAREEGFTSVYLESMPELRKALSVYEKFGFKYLDGPMGNSGHTGCSLWMLRTL